jgi:N-formylglutamate deformylase
MPEQPPFEIRRPAGPPVLLFDSPHSGRAYPEEFVTRASLAELRRAEDAYVDELIASARDIGAVVLVATCPRSFIDLNRREDDIDQAILAEPWPTPLRPTEKSRRGLGLVRRFIVPGVEIYGGPLSIQEVADRIDRIYRPYHRALDELVAELLEARGRVIHVNWHSMKSVGNAMTPDGAGARRADFVVSDRDGRSAGVEVTDLVCDTLRGLGYRVSRNTPYTGGTIVARIGDPARGVHSVQIEINRALYLDEARVVKTSGFEPLRRACQTLAGVLARSF